MKRNMPTLSERITVLLADDHPATRAGIHALLERAPDLRVVGEAEDGNDVQRLVARLRPQVLLLDLIMPGPSPAELEKWVRTNYPDTVVLVLTAHDRDAYLASMMEAGAAGLINKGASGDRLVEAIRRAVHGEILFDQEQLLRARRWREEAGDKWKALTAREREILHLLAEGLDNEQIAGKLVVSPKTIAYHVSNILAKLGLKSRHEATAWLHKYMPEDLE